MKTIHRLVLKSYLGPMVLTFFIVMFVLMMNIVWRYIDELVGKGLSAGIIIELMTYFMANMIPMGLPLSMLLAAIMTMGNLGENYELLAMKSAGMSLVQITKPLIILVSLVSVGSFFIGNNLVPNANKKLFSTLYDIRQQKQALEFQDGLFFNGIDNMSIRVSHQEPDTHLLHDVLIYDNRAANGNMNTIVADSGYIRLSDDKKYLLATDSVIMLPTRERERVWNQARTLAKNSRNMFAFDESTAKEALNQLYRSKVEWHKKMSLPVSILIFFLIGAPLGAIIRKGGLGLPVVVSVIFFVIYYMISLSGEKLAKEGNWEAVYGMWLSTFILTPIAIYLTYKATNDSALLDTDWYAGKFKALKEKLVPQFKKLTKAIKLKRNGKRDCAQ